MHKSVRLPSDHYFQSVTHLEEQVMEISLLSTLNVEAPIAQEERIECYKTPSQLALTVNAALVLLMPSERNKQQKADKRKCRQDHKGQSLSSQLNEREWHTDRKFPLTSLPSSERLQGCKCGLCGEY